MLPMGTSLESLYFFGLHGTDLEGSNFIFLVINRTYETMGQILHEYKGKAICELCDLNLMTEEIYHDEISSSRSKV